MNTDTHLLSLLGFTAEQRQTFADYLELHDMTEKQFLHLAAMHYYDRCAEMDEPHPPASFAGVAPSFCQPETSFKP